MTVVYIRKHIIELGAMLALFRQLQYIGYFYVAWAPFNMMSHAHRPS